MNTLFSRRSAAPTQTRRLSSRQGIITSAPGGASVLSREQIRHLEHPTYLRRQRHIAGLPGHAPRATPGASTNKPR
jgi:hypothetical protein